ncbi:unnamed protein product [Bursaphelenchus xylophilus]|uniref:(pine wood nematode) hypothetical protein n=1 Tax=Bursaphelenchus xylophilus TaxID=6326 RepID=A0A1I7SAB2_BURXY|nr:unnamed protein product [Bursaphelenchus xylophilus]CAG9084113.1 unnamed protein product [Bursaphelenchus xylophilus]
MENWSDVWYLYAYPPSDRLNHALVDGSIDRVFTTPVLRHEQLLTESVSESTSLLKNQEAEDLHITEDKDGLKCLIKAGRMRRAFNLTTQLLVKMGHVPNAPIRRAACSVESLEIWNCRFQLLIALEMQDVLKEEAAAFNELDAPDLYFEFRSQFRRLDYRGSVIPFQFRLIHAEIPRFSAQYEHSLSRLANLENDARQVFESMNNDAHKAVWKRRLEAVRLTQARVVYHMKDHISSITIYEELLEKTEDVDKKKLIMDQLLRITMALGHFKFLESLINSKIGDQVHKRTMWAVFGANYQKALDLLNQSSADSTETCNNKAICYLYTGRVKEAVEILLAHRRAPVPLMKNLYTIGDLASTNSADIRSQHFSKHCASLADLYDPAQLRVL